MPRKPSIVDTRDIDGQRDGRGGSSRWYRGGQDNSRMSIQGGPDIPRSDYSQSNTASSSVPRHDRAYSTSSQDQLVAATSRITLSTNPAQASGNALPNTVNYANVRRQSGYQVNTISITDGELSRNNREAHRRILPSQNNEQLPPGYVQRREPKKYFTFGKVFSAVWTEPAGIHSDISAGSAFSQARYGWVHQKTRFFVVVRSGNDSCTVIPITTYGGRGCGKNVFKNDHGIIYTGPIPPDPLQSELPGRGELPMQQHPIRVMPDHPTDKLLPASRLNYFKFCTVDHSAFVKHFGVVQIECREHLRDQALDCWRRSDADFPRANSVTSTVLIPRVQDETPEDEERRRRVQRHAGAANLHSQHQQQYAQTQGDVSPAEYKARWIAEVMRRTGCSPQQAEQAFLAAQSR